MTMLAGLSLLIWLYLLLAHGRFWQSGPELAPARPASAPPVTVVVPARDEAPLIARTLRSLLAQDYAGPLRIVLVDDGSSDGTGEMARAAGAEQMARSVEAEAEQSPPPPAGGGRGRGLGSVTGPLPQPPPARGGGDLSPLSSASSLSFASSLSSSASASFSPSSASSASAAQPENPAALLQEGPERRLVVLEGKPRPPGWSGKLWAVAQGLAEAGAADLVLLTDADIIHDPRHIATLVAQAERGDLDLVSEMVALACDTPAEHALVPAFVFFFQLLYPFAWVNDPLRATAAAAGGTILIRHRALQRIGGVASVRGALIDDVALAAAVKRGGRIWLGHSRLARSIRAYPTAADICRMVSRTAYVQLRFSPLLLVGTVLAMTLTFLLPPFAALLGHGAARWFGWLTWGAMAAAYQPTLHRFHRSVLWAPCLPAVAAFYLAATIGAAVDHHLGRGVAWKGRAYHGAGA